MLNACCTVPCSGAERRDKVDEVSTAFHGGAAAVKVKKRVYFTPHPETPISQT